MGIGYILVVPDGQKEKTVALLGKKGISAFIIGRIGKGFGGVRYAKN
jgi:phosphoribosylaminoimidazole (AIR) synthetase